MKDDAEESSDESDDESAEELVESLLKTEWWSKVIKRKKIMV
jgi:hypothetical protein